MSLEPADLDDMGYMPESPEEEAALARWEARLGAMYVVVGAIEGDNRAKVQLEADDALLDTALGAGGGAVPEATTTGESCPFTGAVSGTCPFGFQGSQTVEPRVEKGGAPSEAAAMCPWPFIMLHDPATGWENHREMNLLAAAAIAVGLAALIAMR